MSTQTSTGDLELLISHRRELNELNHGDIDRVNSTASVLVAVAALLVGLFGNAAGLLNLTKNADTGGFVLLVISFVFLAVATLIALFAHLPHLASRRVRNAYRTLSLFGGTAPAEVEDALQRRDGVRVRRLLLEAWAVRLDASWVLLHYKARLVTVASAVLVLGVIAFSAAAIIHATTINHYHAFGGGI